MDNQIVKQSPVVVDAIQPVLQPVLQPDIQPLVQSIPNPPKNSNIFIIILIVVIVFFGILLGVLVVKYLSASTPIESPAQIPTVSITPTTPPLAVVGETSSWITYNNSVSQYSIKYPPTWTLVDMSKGTLIEIYNQPDKTEPVGGILIEKIATTPSIIYQYVDTRKIGDLQTSCFSDKALKTWCYLENKNTTKLSFIITRDKDEAYNIILDKILSTFTVNLPLSKISATELSTGWYWGSKEQKLPGTPSSWIFTEGGKYSCWHKKEVFCQVAPSTETKYTCPTTGWVDCMPVLDAAKTIACSPEAMNWYKTNCPDFLGAAL